MLYRAKQDGPVVLVRLNLFATFSIFEPFFVMITDFFFVSCCFSRVGDILGRAMMTIPMGMGMNMRFLSAFFDYSY